MARVSEERTVTEQQFQREVNTAVANTEQEVFDEAMGSDPLDNDGDTSLEEMGEGLEGEHLDADDVEEDVDTEIDPEDDEDDEGGEFDDEREARDNGRQARDERDDRRGERRDDRGDERRGDRARAQARNDDERVDERRQDREEGRDDDRGEARGRDRGLDDRDDRGARVPAWRQRQEAQRRREAEGEKEDLRRELAVAKARLDDLNARVNTPKDQSQPKTDPEPDMFADPEAWKSWQRRQLEATADARVQQGFRQFEQRQTEQMNARVNESFQQAATAQGLVGMEFHAAYAALTSLNPNDPRDRATVAEIYHAPNPARALADWFEEVGAADEFREELRAGLDPQYRPRNPDRGARRRGGERERDRNQDDGYEDRGSRREARDRRDDRDRDNRGRFRDEQPRHEIRRRFIPSLNGAAGGGNSSRNADPEATDNSDAAVLRFAMR